MRRLTVVWILLACLATAACAAPKVAPPVQSPAPVATPIEQPAAVATVAPAEPEAVATEPVIVTPPVVVSPPVEAPPQGPVVYVTETGTKYHKAGCSSLSKSKIPMQLAEAKASGFTACKRCKP